MKIYSLNGDVLKIAQLKNFKRTISFHHVTRRYAKLPRTASYGDGSTQIPGPADFRSLSNHDFCPGAKGKGLAICALRLPKTCGDAGPLLLYGRRVSCLELRNHSASHSDRFVRYRGAKRSKSERAQASHAKDKRCRGAVAIGRRFNTVATSASRPAHSEQRGSQNEKRETRVPL